MHEIVHVVSCDLDAGAGSGILACAFLERIERNTHIKKVELTCYENDENT